MQTELVFTFIAKDEIGILDQFAKLVADHHGNWLASKMAKLAGQFTGIVQVNIDEKHATPLQEALLKCQTPQLSILVELYSLKDNHETKTQSLHLNFIGLDRVGIVKEVSQALVNHNVNVVEFESFTEAAPMAGNLMFKAKAIVEYGVSQSLDQLENELDSIANELDLDYLLELKK